VDVFVSPLVAVDSEVSRAVGLAHPVTKADRQKQIKTVVQKQGQRREAWAKEKCNVNLKSRCAQAGKIFEGTRHCPTRLIGILSHSGLGTSIGRAQKRCLSKMPFSYLHVTFIEGVSPFLQVLDVAAFQFLQNQLSLFAIGTQLQCFLQVFFCPYRIIASHQLNAQL
jgi:hypothetical protein